MKYFVKHLNKDTWLKLYPKKFTQEELDKFKQYLESEGNEKKIKAFDNFLEALKEFKVESKNVPSYYQSRTGYSYIYYFQMPYYDSNKNVSHDLNELKLYSDKFAKLLPFLKALKNIKFKDEEKNLIQYHYLNETLKTIRYCAQKTPWYIGDTLEGVAEEDSIETLFVQSESFAIFSEHGYLNNDGYTSAHLSSARLFPSLQNAKRSLAHQRGEKAIVKIKMEFQDVIMGANKTTDAMKAFVEKKRIEEFLNSTNLETLKAQLAEYEKKLNIQPKEEIKKKQKI